MAKIIRTNQSTQRDQLVRMIKRFGTVKTRNCESTYICGRANRSPSVQMEKFRESHCSPVPVITLKQTVETHNTQASPTLTTPIFSVNKRISCKRLHALLAWLSDKPRCDCHRSFDRSFDVEL